MTHQCNWPSREQWAINRRKRHYYDPNPFSPGNQALDYASPVKIGIAITELKVEWKRLGRELTEAKHAAENLMPRKGETWDKWFGRFNQMTEEEQECVTQPAWLRGERKRINLVIHELSNNELPWQAHNLIILEPPPSPMLNTIWTRYEEANSKAIAAYAEQLAQRPIDDAAWEAELKRRAEFENWSMRELRSIPERKADEDSSGGQIHVRQNSV